MSIFYKIISPSGKVNYLFGTLHKNDDAFVNLPREVKEALEHATDCVFEVDFDNLSEKYFGVLVKLSQQWTTEQRQYQDKIPGDYISSAQKVLDEEIKKNIGEAVSLFLMKFSLPQVSPLKIAELMMKRGNIDRQKFIDPLDQQLMKYAKSKNKSIGVLESLEEQLFALNGFNLNILEQIEYYRFIETERAKGREFPRNEDMEQAYQQQNIEKLNEILRVFPAAYHIPEPVQRYYDGLVCNRDRIMTQRMKPYLENGNAFIAVGAGHLKGITETLHNEGYTIEPVSLGKRYYPVDRPLEDGEKVAAFRKIYTALYMAQTSFFKKRGFIPNDEMDVYLNQIKDYTKVNKDTRSSKAWELAEQHHKNISSNNRELLKSICQEGYAKSSSFFGLFRQTKTNLDDPRSVAEASAKTRTGTVRDILDGCSM